MLALRNALHDGWLAGKPALLYPLGKEGGGGLELYEAVGGGTRFWLLQQTQVAEGAADDRYGWAEVLKADAKTLSELVCPARAEPPWPS